MKLITERSLIRGVADRWAKQYEHDRFRSETLSKLRALDKETATPEDVESVIGNRSWTWLVCDECNAPVKAIVELGQEPDYESSTARICIPCLKLAVHISTI